MPSTNKKSADKVAAKLSKVKIADASAAPVTNGSENHEVSSSQPQPSVTNDSPASSSTTQSQVEGLPVTKKAVGSEDSHDLVLAPHQPPTSHGAVDPSSTNTRNQMEALLRAAQEAKERNMQRRGKGTALPTAPGEAKDFKFWSTQPVPKFTEKVPESMNDPIEVKTVEEVRKEPFGLISGYYWDMLDINDPGTLTELYTLLHDNYVEDDDSMFRFRYSHDFLLWALRPPGWTIQWHLGVRVEGNNKLVAFISAVPSEMRVRGKSMKMAEVNFLCVHKALRSKRMAVILIKEITRRCNVQNIFQAVYTAGTVLPTPIGTCRYWHRSLNPQKLVDVGFSCIKKNMTIQRMKRLAKVDEEVKIAGFRPTELKDIPALHTLLSEYLKKFEIAPEFSGEEIQHYFLPRDKVIYSYVVEDKQSGRLTDFVSFYSLPSTVVKHDKHESIYAAYSFYNVATKSSWRDLLMASLVMAQKENFDVFNALDLMDNKEFINELNFGEGDGNLNYYLFNWKCADVKPPQIGLVLM